MGDQAATSSEIQVYIDGLVQDCSNSNGVTAVLH